MVENSLPIPAQKQAIKTARLRIGREMLLDPPHPVHFGLNPAVTLAFHTTGGRLALKLSLSEPVLGDIMIFGAAPCSPGRMKCRNVTYLGLLPAPVRGLNDITRMYRKLFGLPPAGARIFIRIQQQLDGWKTGGARQHFKRTPPVRALIVGVVGLRFCP